MSRRADRGPAARATSFVARLLSRLVMLTVLGSILGAIVVLMVLPRATQGSALTVLTGSMTPQIPVGSVVFVRPVDTATLEVGDVATYQKEPGVDSYITHRIVEIDSSTDPASLVFKGDANRGRDVHPVPATAVRGEVWFHVPYLGAVRDALNGKAGLGLLAMLVLGCYAIGQVFSAIRDARRPEDGPDADAASADAEPADIAPGRLASVEVQDEADQTICSRILVIAELPRQGSPPERLARELDGVLLRETADSCTILAAPPPGDLDAVLFDVRMREPISVTTTDAHHGPLVLSSTAAPTASPVSALRRESHAGA